MLRKKSWRLTPFCLFRIFTAKAVLPSKGRDIEVRNAARLPEFCKLLLASFISQTGSHFLTIALAGFVFTQSGSLTKASLIFILSYLPAIFVAAQIGHWIDCKLSRWLLVRNDVLAIIISALCGICVAFALPLGLLCGLVAVRSLLLFATRSGVIKWIKLITPATSQPARIKIFYLTFFISTAVAGVLVATVLKTPTILVIVLLDAGTYLLSIITFFTLRKLVITEIGIGTLSVGTLRSLREIFRIRILSAQFAAVCFSQSIFQGAYSVLVYYLPLDRFQLGLQGLGAFQIAASLGIIGGFLIVWRAPTALAQQQRGKTITLITFLGVGIVGILVSISTTALFPSLLCFSLFNCAYECIWLHNSSEFVQLSPQTTVARYQLVMTACASCAMAGFTFFYAGLIQLLGVQTGVLVVLLAGLIVWGCVSQWNVLHRYALKLDEVGS